ncbi:nicotinate phosphoribosyltransferase [Flavobacterium sp. 1355]|nr:nicotinate phosphoribosyltransferase [Flavobacterium sp. 1355]
METTFLKSILDNDFYKFTMQHAVIKLFPKAKVRYGFINRGKHVFPPGFADLLRKSVNAMADLRLTKEEKRYLAHYCHYLDPTYLDFLQGYSFDPSEVEIKQHGSDIEVTVEGFWYRTILWEVPLMALISELFYKTNHLFRLNDEAIKSLTKEKIDKYNKLEVSILEFGTRRRHSYDVHVLVNETLNSFGGESFIGTSNVHFAMVNNKRPLGTHAHEWFMFHAAQYGFKMANSISLEHWTKVYGGDLGIALTDTYTTDIFFSQFDKKYSKLFDGVRHDSGDRLNLPRK